MAEVNKNLFELYKDTGGKLDSGAAPKEEFVDFLENKLKASGKTTDRATLEKIATLMDNGDGKITADEVNKFEQNQLKVTMTSIFGAQGITVPSNNQNLSETLRTNVEAVLAVLAPARYVQGKLLQEAQKDFEVASGKSPEGGVAYQWLKENGATSTMDWMMEHGLGEFIDLTRGVSTPKANGKDGIITHADGSAKTVGEVWKDNKGLVLGASGAIIGGLMALFTGGSGWLILLFGLLGFGGGALADNGVFDGRGESSNKNTGTKTEKQNETSAEPQQGQSQEQSLEANLKSLPLKNGNMAVRGTVEGNQFIVQEVAVKRKDGNWNHRDNGELIFTPVNGATITFPTYGKNLGSDAQSIKNIDILQRLGNLGNGEDIGYNTINQNTLNQAKIAAQNLNLPVEHSCITNSLQACTYRVKPQNPLNPAVAL